MLITPEKYRNCKNCEELFSELISSAEVHGEEIGEKNRMIERLKNENKRMIECLNFYADGYHYRIKEGIEKQTLTDDGGVEITEGDIELENGDKAYELLVQLEKRPRDFNRNLSEMFLETLPK